MSTKVLSLPFIVVVEGVDFSGKTTLAYRLQTVLRKQSHRVKILHDPKGSNNGQIIWNTILILQGNNGHPITELFLFLAARNELIHQEALTDEVDVIIFDRFIFSTIAYQLTCQPQYWELFLTIHRSFSHLMPDLCIYCDVDFDVFQVRCKGRNKQDPFDQMNQRRFNAIQDSYEKILALEICPSLRVNHLKDDEGLVALVEKMLALRISKSLSCFS